MIDLSEISCAKLARFYNILSQDEQQRADSYRTSQLRNNYVAARGHLRSLLASFTGIRPNEIELTYGPYGKPRSKDQGSPYFNVSHAGDRALFAFSRETEVGIDIEVSSHSGDFLALESLCLTEAERKRVGGFGSDRRGREFLRTWTRKEAYVKAIGHGLSCPFEKVEIIPTTEKCWYSRDLRRVQDAIDERWHGTDLDVCSSYIAAVAYQPPASRIRLTLESTSVR